MRFGYGIGAAEQPLDLGAAEHALAAALRPGRSSCSSRSTGSATIQPERRAKRITLWSVASALAAVFAQRFERRSSCRISATSSTVREAIARRPKAGNTDFDLLAGEWLGAEEEGLAVMQAMTAGEPVRGVGGVGRRAC
jgi:hypothetical protein